MQLFSYMGLGTFVLSKYNNLTYNGRRTATFRVDINCNNVNNEDCQAILDFSFFIVRT